MNQPLILISGAPTSTRTLKERQAPRLDYLEIARLLDAELSYPADTPGLVERFERRTVEVNLGQAWRARRTSTVALSVPFGAVWRPHGIGPSVRKFRGVTSGVALEVA